MTSNAFGQDKYKSTGSGLTPVTSMDNGTSSTAQTRASQSPPDAVRQVPLNQNIPVAQREAQNPNLSPLVSVKQDTGLNFTGNKRGARQTNLSRFLSQVTHVCSSVSQKSAPLGKTFLADFVCRGRTTRPVYNLKSA